MNLSTSRPMRNAFRCPGSFPLLSSEDIQIYIMIVGQNTSASSLVDVSFLELYVAAVKAYNTNCNVLLLLSPVESQHGTNHFINKDWIGIKSPVDAVLAGRLYVSPRYLQRPSRRRQDQLGRQQWNQQLNQQWNQQLNQQWNQQWNQDWSQQGDKPWKQDWTQQWDQQWNQDRIQQWNQDRNQQWDQMWNQDRNQQWDQMWKQEQQSLRHRQKRSPFWDIMANGDISINQEYQRFSQDPWRGQDRRRNGYQQQHDNDYEHRYNPSDDSASNPIRWSRPLQSVYFFKGGTEITLPTFIVMCLLEQFMQHT